MSRESVYDDEDHHHRLQEQMEFSSGEEEELLKSPSRHREPSQRGVSTSQGVHSSETAASSPSKMSIPKPVQIEDPKVRDRFPLDDGLKAKFEAWMGGPSLTHTERESLVATLPLVDSSLALAPRIEESLARESSSSAKLGLSDGALFALQDTLCNAMNQMAFGINCIKEGREEDACGYLDVAGKLFASGVHDLTVMRRERILISLKADTRVFTNYRWAPVTGNEPVRSASGRGEVRHALFGSTLMASYKDSSKDKEFIDALRSSSKQRPSLQASGGYRRGTHLYLGGLSRHDFGSPRLSASVSSQDVHTARMQDIPKSLNLRGFSEAASALVLSSWAKNTVSQYDSSLRKWIDFCKISNCQSRPTDATLSNFLAHMKNLGYAYRSVASHKAAVCTFYGLFSNETSFPLTERVLKGIFRADPPKPKYCNVWDVSDILKGLKGWGKSSSLCLKDLTMKTVMLLSLASPNRVSEIASLSLEKLVKTKNTWTFDLGMTKNRTVSGDSHTASYDRFPKDTVLCPIATLEEYLSVTAYPNRHNRIFLSYTGKHDPVSSVTISRWIKSILVEFGYVSFGAHSTRAAATSKALHSGLSSAQILKAANWAPNGSTFEKFYLKGKVVGPPSFQDTVLGSRSVNKGSNNRDRHDEPSTSRGRPSAYTPSSSRATTSTARTPMKRRVDDKKTAAATPAKSRKPAK